MSTKKVEKWSTNLQAMRRNLWTRKETLALLKIFKERNVVGLLMRKSNSPIKIFKMVENLMVARGFACKSTLQIMRKWKKLKSVYTMKYRPKSTSNENETKIPYFNEIHELMTGRILVTTANGDGDVDEFFAQNGLYDSWQNNDFQCEQIVNILIIYVNRNSH